MNTPRTLAVITLPSHVKQAKYDTADPFIVEMRVDHGLPALTVRVARKDEGGHFTTHAKSLVTFVSTPTPLLVLPALFFSLPDVVKRYYVARELRRASQALTNPVWQWYINDRAQLLKRTHCFGDSHSQELCDFFSSPLVVDADRYVLRQPVLRGVAEQMLAGHSQVIRKRLIEFSKTRVTTRKIALELLPTVYTWTQLTGQFHNRTLTSALAEIEAYLRKLTPLTCCHAQVWGAYERYKSAPSDQFLYYAEKFVHLLATLV